MSYFAAAGLLLGTLWLPGLDAGSTSNFPLAIGAFVPNVPRPLSMKRIVFLTATIATVTAAWALHPKSAGPENAEIKFKLPPPKPLTPAEELKTFKLAPGFHAELFASEPMIETPIAMSWDEHGRMFVLEMRGYMHDVEGAGETEPSGVVSILEDTDGDGKADKKTVFADGLVLPRALACVNGGALVGEPPVLWFMKDTNGDGKADVKEQVDGSFGSRTGQPEHMSNSPTRLMDNWIYCANHGTRYKFRDGKWLSDSMGPLGQWGMTQDDYGRPYYNFNSDFLRADLVPASLYKRNPNWPGAAGTGEKIVKDQSTWPIAPTPGVNRGYEANALTEDGRLKACTATCGAGIYRANLFGKGFEGNAFIPEPAGNLVKRFILSEKDGVVSGENVVKGQEFMASTDERFRPVNAYTGPDGALYIADMYRGVIQHKGFLTYYLVANIKDRKLEQPVNMGRIWRIVPDGAKPVATKLPTESSKLVPFLGDPNGWVRDTAQRLLVERKDAVVAPAVAALVKSGNPFARMHALWTLEGMSALTPDVVGTALKDTDPKVRALAVRLADRSLAPELAKLATDKSVDVQVALAFTASAYPETAETTLSLARTAGANLLVRDAILSGLRGRELETLEALVKGNDKAPDDLLGALAGAVMNERKAARVKKLIELIAAQKANSPVQLALLTGASGKNSPKNAPKPKLLYLDSEAPELAKIASSIDSKSKALFTAFDTRVAWPGKPGVPPPPVVKPLTAAEQKLYDTGKQVYSTICVACHQPNGFGLDGLAPALVDSNWVLGNPEILPKIVIHGLTGEVKVNERTWELEMPPLGAALSDEQVAGVLTYIRREWEHTASPVSVDLVKKIRSENSTRTKAWTAPELGMSGKAKK